MTQATRRPAQPIRLHGLKLSGHSHRAELFLSLLGLPFDFVEVDFMGGQHKSPPFLAKNPFGQVPVIEDGDVVLPDSAAILVYLARAYGDAHWLPDTPRGAAEVQRWLSVAAGQLAFGPAAARLITLFGAKMNPQEVIGRAHNLLGVMEQTLGGHDWLIAGAQPTIADVALYSYTLTAPEGNVSLADYPQVRAWLARIEALPGFVAMPRSAVGLAA